VEKIAKIKRIQKFAYFTGNDIMQEVWVICLKALEHYKSQNGNLENYLNRCVNNRLKNLKRDRYFRLIPEGAPNAHHMQTRINLMNALPLGRGDINQNDRVLGSASASKDPSSRMVEMELNEFIEARLEGQMLKDFKKLRSGGKVLKDSSLILEEEVRQLIKEFNE
jgi:DNA-directed RNA polymerase specialized sigma24 family protein